MANGDLPFRTKEYGGKTAGVLGKRQGYRKFESTSPKTQSEKMLEEQRQQMLVQQEQEAAEARRGALVGIGRQLGTARGVFQRSAGRAGLTGSGIEQAGLQALQAASANTLQEFEGKLRLAQQAERSAFRQQSFQYLQSMNQMFIQADLERDMMEFQAQLAANQQQAGWLQGILSTGFQIADMYFTSGMGKAAMGAGDYLGTDQFVQSYNPPVRR